jgi:hypothetical protein
VDVRGYDGESDRFVLEPCLAHELADQGASP